MKELDMTEWLSTAQPDTVALRLEHGVQGAVVPETRRLGRSIPLLILYPSFFFLSLWLHGVLVAARAFSRCGWWRLPLDVVCRLLVTVASLAAEPGLEGERASVVVAHRLSCPLVCGIFPDRGSNPCPWRWQVDSLLDHQQGLPMSSFKRHVG